MGNISSTVGFPSILSQVVAIQTASPSAGNTVNVANSSAAIIQLILTPAALLGTLTVVMPTTPANGQTVQVCCTQVVTTLTVSPAAGQTISGVLTAFTANGFSSHVYNAANTNWYRVA